MEKKDRLFHIRKGPLEQAPILLITPDSAYHITLTQAEELSKQLSKTIVLHNLQQKHPIDRTKITEKYHILLGGGSG